MMNASAADAQELALRFDFGVVQHLLRDRLQQISVDHESCAVAAYEFFVAA